MSPLRPSATSMAICPLYSPMSHLRPSLLSTALCPLYPVCPVYPSNHST
jgi:hypothetical protein